MAIDVPKPKNYRRGWRGGVNLVRKITVCDSCLMACCWQGQMYCDNAKSAGTVDKTLAELHSLNREHPSWWFTDPSTGAVDHEGLDAFTREYHTVTVSGGA